MRWQHQWFVGVGLGVIAVSGAVVWSQEGGGQPREVSPYLAAPAQVVAVRAGRLFDARTGRMLTFVPGLVHQAVSCSRVAAERWPPSTLRIPWDSSAWWWA